ncbi:glycoside hydrolase family 27 protein [Maribellus sp. YY47]|uniref:glycoside hydrolase family 27 protein n=1 Tax=Maribellus sp. YY47 TaxID=2929486 RepID=UPI002001D654|nr:glycoside hydrolase family 27 protein [Maribellus sp. YY47]MCK3685565.1 glycoside hydrolase family 27 protein [Maribellus sp. YY47]
MRVKLTIVMLMIASFCAYAQKFDKLAQTPPMGWNSWNKFACDVSEDLIMGMADAMVSSGMKDAGYEYVVIDDCWQVGRDENGEIIVDKERFPHGIKYLADYIHSKGLKFGIYSCAGSETCAGRPGGLGHEYQDARSYASWGVDYLKYDWCNTTTQDSRSSYTNMRDALYTAGRPIVFSICEWGGSKPWEWAKDVGHLWRTTGDILDRWDAMIGIVDKQRDLAKYAGPGHWNDPDMLEVGNGGMTNEEYKTHFSMWCMMAAPLMAGNDLANMSEETKEILTNNELIAIDQDPIGQQASCYRDNGDYEIWGRALENDEKAVCLLNRSDEEKEVQVNFTSLLKTSDNYWYTYPYNLEDYNVRDVWEQKEVKTDKSIIMVKMPPHSVKVYRFLKKK